MPRLTTTPPTTTEPAGSPTRQTTAPPPIPRIPDAVTPARTLAARLPLALPPSLPDVEGAVLPLDKPAGMTSFDVIRRLRPLLGTRKIGHAGTLDPMATGLLVCLIGCATKAQDHFLGQPKAYEATIRLGESTPSQDAETEVSERRDASAVPDEAIAEAAAALTGEIAQLPPMYSAVKVQGQRLYTAARKGEDVARETRPVVVYRFDVDAVRNADESGGPVGTRDVDVFVACSKGTYVRTLAHDIGEALGVGGHLVRLRRTHIGDLDVASAWTLDALADALGKPLDATWRSRITPKAPSGDAEAAAEEAAEQGAAPDGDG